MANPKRPAANRQGHQTRDIGVVPAEQHHLAPGDVPKPPPGLLRATRTSWDRYFRSAAMHVTVLSLDLDLLERLWTLYDERTRAQRELRRARIVVGSTGQTRPSGFYSVIATLDAEIRQLEDRVAKHMKSRLTLGMVVGDGDRADDEPRQHEPDDFDDGPGEDPRLYVVGRTVE